MSTTTRPESGNSFSADIESSSVFPVFLALGQPDEIGGIPVFYRLQVLAIENELALALEHLVARPDEAHVLVARLLVEVRADRIDGVADEHRLDEAQPVVAVGKGIDAIGGDEAEPCGE